MIQTQTTAPTPSAAPAASGIQFETRYCTLCGPEAGKRVKYPANFSEDDFNAAVFSARRMPDQHHFRLVECGSCQMIYSDPVCDPSKLASLYQEATVNYGSQADQIYESYAAILDEVIDMTSNRGTFLEIGGGDGFMLKYGAQKGFARQIEIEPSSDAEAKFKPASPNAQFIRGVFKRGMLPPNSVSVACFFQMLDHVPDPGEFLRAVFEVVEPGGLVLSVTHTTQALSAKLLGEKSPIFDIEHTYLFNPSNLSKLLEKAGFSQVRSFSVANRYALRHWLHMAPLPGKKKLLPITEKLGLADIRINLKAGNFAAAGIKA